jgi:hypothetical protein
VYVATRQSSLDVPFRLFLPLSITEVGAKRVTWPLRRCTCTFLSLFQKKKKKKRDLISRWQLQVEPAMGSLPFKKMIALLVVAKEAVAFISRTGTSTETCITLNNKDVEV